MNSRRFAFCFEYEHQTASEDKGKENGNVQYCFEFLEGSVKQMSEKLTDRTIALRQNSTLQDEINLHTASTRAEFHKIEFFKI